VSDVSFQGWTVWIADERYSVLCGDQGIKQIDEPFIHDTDDTEEWSI
jgi:hypothetical protein